MLGTFLEDLFWAVSAEISGKTQVVESVESSGCSNIHIHENNLSAAKPAMTSCSDLELDITLPSQQK